jgi:choline dehydrogenase-like flavoprotein
MTQSTSYDVIIVGAGGAGAPLAARLSEDPQRQVLLIEAGNDFTRTEDFPFEVRYSGAIGGALPGNPNNWTFMGKLTADLSYPVPRGKIVGGSTSINGTGFQRPRKSDFDRWVAAGNTEWSYEDALPYMIKLERDLDYGSDPVHGNEGPMPVSRNLETVHPITTSFYEACSELGFVHERDKNAEQHLGYGPMPRNAVDGLRYNTAITYLNPNRRRPNLTIRANTVVNRVTFDGTTVTGVELDGGSLVNGREVVLCAGALQTPQLLLLSGVGSKEELGEHGITPVSELPGVGKNLMDHPDVEITWRPKRKLGSKKQRDSFQGVLNFTSQNSQYNGDMEIIPLIKPIAAMLLAREESGLKAFLTFLRRAPEALRSLKGVNLKRIRQQAATRNDHFVVAACNQPDSRGRVSLTSADPNDLPTIEYNYMTNDSDRRRMREVVRTATSILESKAFEALFDRMTELTDRILADDALLDDWIRSHLAPTFHAACTARMGPRSDPEAVVDQRGRVYGVSGLRVADISICPTIPTVGPGLAAIMIGERMADFIREDQAALSTATTGTPESR